MAKHLVPSFQHHLVGRGLQPGTIDAYGGILQRLLSHAGVAEEQVTVDHAYAFLIERARTSRRTSSWYNVNYWAVVRFLEMRGLPTTLRGLEPHRRRRCPPRWLESDAVRRLVAGVGDPMPLT